ncbi:hypothetical protein J7T55_012640 [Diaporthe amygdali]|uniref:uncharacterized protein n=1 Tax=Phomopsis amygdali TaxID=1214568 RepID=UPI0022FE17AA|nr:uncharacterized protein J7T55_012640 [Diaporthe amygdali]KAJ0115362.1 hypothetical protein J7T55_012640 [Diaporthe amygdali]
MPSFSYSISARLARTVGSTLSRVWTGRVSKTSSTRRRTTSPPGKSLGLIHPDPIALASRSSSFEEEDGPEHQVKQENDRAIKKEEDQCDYSIAAHEDDHEYSMGADSEEELDEEEMFEDSLSHAQDVVSMLGDVADMDKPIQSIEVYDEILDSQDASPSLRGGTRVPEDGDDGDEEDDDANQDEYEDDDDYEQPPTNPDDYYESEEDFEDEYDVDQADLDWYRLERTRVANIRDWARDAAKAHKLMTLCGQYSLLPSSWECDLIDHPYLTGLFAPIDEEKKTLIRAESNQFRATRALRNLFELHIRICAYRQDGLHDKIGDLIDKEIRKYNAAVEKDAKLLGSYAYSSPIMIIKFATLQFAQVDEDQLQTWVHQQAMLSCRRSVEDYHNQWAQRGVEHYPRVMYAFVIIQQTVQIWAIDTELPEEQLGNPYPLRSIDMSKRNDWLNCTFSIAIPIYLAKESLLAHRWNFPKVEVEDSDTDL